MGNGPDEASNRPRGEAGEEGLIPGAKPGAESSTVPAPTPPASSEFRRPHGTDTDAAGSSPSTSDRPYSTESDPPSAPGSSEPVPSEGQVEPEANYHPDSAESTSESSGHPSHHDQGSSYDGSASAAYGGESKTSSSDTAEGSPTEPNPPASGGGGPGESAGGDSAEDDDGGGPVKSFFEHLEDLRWVLVKSAVAIGIAVMLCLISGNWLVGVIKWPLRMTTMPKPNVPQTVSFEIGTNFLGTVYLQTNQWGPINLGTNDDVVLQLTPIEVGTNQVLALQRVEGRGSKSRTLEESIQLLNLNPAGGFFVAFQVAIYGGLVLASPFVLYYLVDFIFPALRRIERKYVRRGMALGIGLFMMGILFCYFVLMPLALRASVAYSEWLGFAANQWRAEEYISFVCKFLLGMGLGFELPIVVLTLVKIGLINHQQLAAFRKYMIVINLMLGAVLTTPEVLTQVMMALPLQVLYEISVWIAWYWERQERKRTEAEAKVGA